MLASVISLLAGLGFTHPQEMWKTLGGIFACTAGSEEAGFNYVNA